MTDSWFTVDAFGDWAPGEVYLHYTDTPLEHDAELETAIADAWEMALEDAKRRGATLFNGEMVAGNDHEVRDGALHIEARPTDYREFVGTNLYNGHCVEEFGHANFANPLGNTAILISNDGKILLGRRNQKVFWHGGYVHTFGGAIEKADIQADGSIDVFASVKRELVEEMAIGDGDIREIRCRGLIHDAGIHQPELLFDVWVNLTEAEIRDRLKDGDEEHEAIESLEDAGDAVVPFILDSAPIAPVAIGALMLHGKHCWGEEWYVQAMQGLISP